MEKIECRRLDDYTAVLSNLFGETLSSNFGYIDAEVGDIPPFVTDIPGHPYDCFTFDEIATDACKSQDAAERQLCTKIDDYLDSKGLDRKLYQTATLLWRIKPEIGKGQIVDGWDKGQNERPQIFYQGYTRLMILTKDSERRSYH